MDDEILQDILVYIIRRAVLDSQSRQIHLRADAIKWLQSDECRQIFSCLNLPYDAVNQHLKDL